MDELLMERYALAKERVCEIKEEKAVQMPYLDFFQKTAAFLEKNVEIMDGVVFLGEAREPRKLADAADLSIDEWKELNRDLYADILPENYRNSYGNPVYACEKEAGTLHQPVQIQRILYHADPWHPVFPGILLWTHVWPGDCISGLLPIKGNLRKRICRFEAFQSAFQQPVLLIRIEKYADHQHI